MDGQDVLTQLEEATGGTATLHQLKNEDGEVVHSFATMSMPLRKTHWIYQKAEDGFGFPPPMPLRIGSDGEIGITITEVDPAKNPGWVGARTLTLDRRQMADLIRMAGRYAVRSATMHGAEMDFDPDALLQNLVVGFLGYWTENGLSGDDFENPKETFVSSGPPPADPSMSPTGANPAA